MDKLALLPGTYEHILQAPVGGRALIHTQLVELRHAQTGRLFHARVLIVQNGRVALCILGSAAAVLSNPQAPLKCIRINELGVVEPWGGPNDAHAQFEAFETMNSLVQLKCCAHAQRGWHLGVDPTLVWVGDAQTADPGQASYFEVRCIRLLPLTHETFCKDVVSITDNVKRQFVDHGFVVIPGVVKKPFIDAALKHINKTLFEASGNTLEHSSDPAIVNLCMRTHVWSILQEFMGRGNAQPVGGGQLALRFPGFRGEATAAKAHGQGWHTDGQDKLQHSPFSMLVGVCLSGQEGAEAGNLIVFPGSHLATPAWLRRMVQGENVEKPKFHNPHTVILQAGDMVIAHHKTAHMVAKNDTPNIRYQVYFRVNHINHKQYANSAESGYLLLDNIWAEFEGLWDVIHGKAGQQIPGGSPAHSASSSSSTAF